MPNEFIVGRHTVRITPHKFHLSAWILCPQSGSEKLLRTRNTLSIHELLDDVMDQVTILGRI